jgi:hypothetical protein
MKGAKKERHSIKKEATPKTQGAQKERPLMKKRQS